MVWWIDEYLDLTLRKIDLCPGVDVAFTFHGVAKDYSDDIDVSIFWHSPSVNLGWYPICQIDHGCRTVFHREGAENDERWHDLLEQAADFLAQELQATSTITEDKVC